MEDGQYSNTAEYHELRCEKTDIISAVWRVATAYISRRLRLWWRRNTAILVRGLWYGVVRTDRRIADVLLETGRRPLAADRMARSRYSWPTHTQSSWSCAVRVPCEIQMSWGPGYQRWYKQRAIHCTVYPIDADTQLYGVNDASSNHSRLDLPVHR